MTALREIADDRLPFGEARCLVVSGLDELLAISGRFADFIDERPDIDADEPWFGFVFAIDGELLLELDFYPRVIGDPASRDKIERYVRDVIAFNRAHHGEPTLYVNEELEAGSHAVEALLGADLDRYLPLYLEYLAAIDLDHTVEQHDLARRLGERVDDAQRQRLTEALEGLSSGELLNELLGRGA